MRPSLEKFFLKKISKISKIFMVFCGGFWGGQATKLSRNFIPLPGASHP